jgi:hypothetical protein
MQGLFTTKAVKKGETLLQSVPYVSGAPVFPSAWLRF